MKYPRLVYQSADGETFTHLQVVNVEQREEALADGWSDSVPESFESHCSKNETPAKRGRPVRKVMP